MKFNKSCYGRESDWIIRKDFEEFIKLLDWDKDDYDKLKLEIEKRFENCDRSCSVF